MSLPHKLQSFRHLLIQAASQRPNDEFSQGDNVRRNLAAYTTPNVPEYPQYVSINREGDQVLITVRSPRDSDGKCGSTSTATLSLLEWRSLLLELVSSD